VSLRQTRLGEFDSPERNYQVSPWIHLQQIRFPTPFHHTRYPTHHKQRFIHTNIQYAQTDQRQPKNRLRTTQTRNPNFPYLEKRLTELRHGTSEHNNLKDGLAQLAKQRRTRLFSDFNRWKTNVKLYKVSTVGLELLTVATEIATGRRTEKRKKWV